MRTTGAFIVSVVVALVVISALAGRDAAQRVVTGTVGGYVNGQWISVVNETTDPTGFQIALRETTAWHRARDSRHGVVQKRGRAPVGGR